MQFVVYCLDKPDHGAVRQANRQAHLDYAAGYGNQIVAGGPLQSDDGEAMVGSMLIIDVADRTAAEAFCAGDPYAKAGLFQSVEVRRWKKVLPMA